jgi:putative mRNA 3-end processing factor
MRIGKLVEALFATEAEKVYFTHGSTASFGRFLQKEKGIDAVELKTLFGEEKAS